MVRLSGGKWKGLPLASPRQIRATSAKVRQALGNILGFVVEGARVLDGFAGSGAVGLEMLSRGASFAAFVDSDTDAVMSIRENLERLGPELTREAWRLLHMDIERALRELSRSEKPFDLVLLDPPYGSDLGKKALNSVVEYAILAPAGIVAIEHEQRATLPPVIGYLRAHQRHRYGDTVLSFYRSE